MEMTEDADPHQANEFGSKTSPSLPTASRSSKPTSRFQARSPKPAKSGLIDDTEESETLDEEDEEILGLPKRRKGKKESLMDMLNSEPPWAQSGSAGPATSSKGLSKAERMMGASADASQVKASSRPRGRTLPDDSPLKFAPISNLEALGNFATSESSVPTGANASSAPAGQAADPAEEAPSDPPRLLPGRLQSHKSSPDLSRGLFPSEQKSGSYASLSPMPRKRLVAKDERTLRSDRNDDLLDFFKNTPPPPPTSMPYEASEPTTPSNSTFGGRSTRSSKIKGFLSPSLGRKSSQAPMLPIESISQAVQAAPVNIQSSSMFRMPSMPRARQSSRDMDVSQMTDDFGRPPRKLSKATGILRTASQRSRQTTAEKQEELNLPLDNGSAAYDGDVPGSQKYVFPDIFGTSSTVSAGHIGTVQPVPMAVPLLTPDTSRDSLFKIATGKADTTGQLSPPLSTGRSANPPISHFETPLQTPPATPQEKRVPAFPGSLAASLASVPEMRRTASDGVIIEKQHRRQSSLVKRKPSPRFEPGEELPGLYGSGITAMPLQPVNPLLLSAMTGERKASIASTASSASVGLKRELSTRSGGSSYHGPQESVRSREASSASFMSMSSGSIRDAETPVPETASVVTARSSGAVAPASLPSQEISIPAPLDLGKEEMETIPAPLFTAQSFFRSTKVASAAQKDAISRSFMTSSGSRPVSAILVSGSYGVNGRAGKPDPHDVLLSLRNEMLGAQNVADCLELLDNAMFEIAYEIKPAGQETIIEEQEVDTGVFDFEGWAPASICENRAFLAILEFIIDPVELKYPKGFHCWQATVILPVL